MDLSVAEYARQRGISRQRALALIHSGQVDARRIGRSWVVSERELGHRRQLGRPLGERMAQVLVNVLSGQPLSELDPQSRYFAASYLDRLRVARDPAALLHSWLRSRQLRVVNVAANPADLAEIRRDDRLVVSGISDGRSGMSSARELEGYVAAAAVDAFMKTSLMVRSDSPNVRLHIVENLPPSPAPVGLVIADLADWNRPRVDSRVAELLEEYVWTR